MNVSDDFEFVSVHGGHSAQFCDHAQDALSDIIIAYIQQGFAWVGITEHMPPPTDRFLDPDQQLSGLSARQVQHRFDEYMSVCRSLQARHRSTFDVYVGFETEYYSGSLRYARELRRTYAPDYIVGSVHHINDVCFDYSPASYRQALDHAGGPLNLYKTYFDQQYRMISELTPEVVGHFDLVRIFDDDYPARLQHPEIQDKIQRNLQLIADRDLILDLNVRAFLKGASEPYPSEGILKMAVEMGIAIVTGDDSHGVSTVGMNLGQGVDFLQRLGGSTRWRRPINP
jgi:histidinol-phosphatase (PHP family)